MLATMLEKLQGLLSKGLLIASLLPLAMFFFFSALVVGRLNPEYRFLLDVFFDETLTIGSRAVKAAIVLLALAVLAYVFSTLGTSLRLYMEGVSWPECLRDLGIARHNRVLGAHSRALQEVRDARKRVIENGDSWKRSLLVARAAQPKVNDPCVYPADDPTRLLVTRLTRLKDQGRHVPFDELEAAVGDLAAVLRANTMRPHDEASRRLDRDQTTIRELIEYSERQLRRELIDRFNARQFAYGADVVAPTAMGNVAESIRSYAWSRYELNLDVFWPRLQKVMQADSGFYTVLTDAKIQLDFFVSMFWLTVLYLVIWLPVLAVWSHTLWLYLVVALIGPAVAVGAYRLAVHNYLAFAELMRSAIDTYRLKLLEALQMPSPANTVQEGRMWRVINKRMGYGESFPLTYKNKDGP